MSNRLAAETSPYLLQHADNPVDWHPWDSTALQLAREANKPILLSIGYSTCHWCHVMARESFEDDATAAVMNELYVNIKVDREERPDLDKIYQTALTLLTQQGGGWPLTMVLDPHSLVPIFGGTYFPKTPRHQLPGFSDLLRRIHEAYTTKHDELQEQSEKIKAALEQLKIPAMEAQLADLQILDAAREKLAQQYDHQDGGFGSAPKFPMPTTLNRLLRHWAYQKREGSTDLRVQKDTLDMVMISLTQMARGGIYDHIGGGFCRYATDRKWMIPHFEKMLYDNGQLLSLYSDALKLGPDELFSGAVEQTIDWLVREMRDPQGAFFAALDADSEGAEGRFYVWRRNEVKRLLSEDEYLVVETLYGLDKPANFEGKWNLHRHDSWRSVVSRLSLEGDTAEVLLHRARGKLFDARSERVRPATDTKILTAWNGLTIRGLADAARQFSRAEWLRLAQDAADFLAANAWDGEVLYATWQDGNAKYAGYLDDYANLLSGMLALLETEWRDQDLTLAQSLADALLAHFTDAEQGGFFFTSDTHEQLLHRPKPSTDDALPPGNGTAALALLKLGHLLAEPVYIQAAQSILAWARALLERLPSGHCSLLDSLEFETFAQEQIILRGPIDQMSTWRRALEEGYSPWRSVYLIPYESTAAPTYLPRLVSSATRERVTAFLCSGLECSPPIQDLDELLHTVSH
ncbi:MAG: thioredoxin domain-containing protein [Pseudomonadota bacterium]